MSEDLLQAKSLADDMGIGLLQFEEIAEDPRTEKQKFIESELIDGWDNIEGPHWLFVVHWNTEGCTEFVLTLFDDYCSLDCSGLTYTDRDTPRGMFGAKFNQISYEEASKRLIKYMHRLYDVYVFASRDLEEEC